MSSHVTEKNSSLATRMVDIKKITWCKNKTSKSDEQ